MTREEAIKILKSMSDISTQGEAIDMAIEALQTEPIRCDDCTHQDECEEVVLFDISDDEVMGHRLHWCSYGERREP